MSQAKTTLQRNLKIGVKGEDVKIIQKFLGLNADGVFGKKTAEKVKEWQMMKNLTADGIVGSKTMLLMK
jgi:peptidoglycan hydrolase-like protein with peptidoglycan-binding domain